MGTSCHGAYTLAHSRVEKYRPRRLVDVVGNTATIERLQAIEANGNCPHLLVSVRTEALTPGPARYR